MDAINHTLTPHCDWAECGQNVEQPASLFAQFSPGVCAYRLQMRSVWIDKGAVPDRFLSRRQLPLSKPSFIKSPWLVNAQQM